MGTETQIPRSAHVRSVLFLNHLSVSKPSPAREHTGHGLPAAAQHIHVATSPDTAAAAVSTTPLACLLSVCGGRQADLTPPKGRSRKESRPCHSERKAHQLQAWGGRRGRAGAACECRRTAGPAARTACPEDRAQPVQWDKGHLHARTDPYLPPRRSCLEMDNKLKSRTPDQEIL